MRHAGGSVGAEVQAPGGLVGPHQRLQSRFVDGDAAGLQRRHLGGIDVDAHHFVADVGQHGPLHQTDVAGAENGDFHVL